MRPTYIINATTLEKFRRYMVAFTPYDTEAALMEAILGIFEGNDLTRVGGAFHKMIERPARVKFLQAYDQDWWVSQRIALPWPVGNFAMSYNSEHPLAIYEVPVKKVYHTDKHSVMISGRIDNVEGVHEHDAKLKFSPLYSLAEYTDSLQWKLYTDILDLDDFYYDIYTARGFEKLLWGENGIRFAHNLTVEREEPVHCYRYDGMGAEILYYISLFMDYVADRNIFHLLKQLPAPVEPAA